MMFDSPRYMGGPVVNLRRLIPRLVARGHQVQVLVLYDGGSPSAEWLAREAGVLVERFPWRSPPFTEERVRWILARLRRWPPDLFVPDHFVSGYFASRWARAAGIPTLGYFRSDDPFYWQMVGDFVTGDPAWALSGVICVSSRLQERIRTNAGSRTKFAYIPSGVSQPSAISNQSAAGLRVVYVGRLEERQKRIRETAAALMRNLENGVCDHVGFVGHGSQRKWLEETVVSRGLSDRVTIFGPIPEQKISEVLSFFQVITLLSDYEGTPAAVMDGMACGLVPLTTRLSDGTSEVVRDGVTGLQCCDRQQDFDRCLLQLRNSPALRGRLASAGRELIASSFTIEQTVKRWEAFADELTSGGAAKRRTIRLPLQLNLPPVRAAFSNEDIRRPRWGSHVRSLKDRLASKVGLAPACLSDE